MSQILDSTYKWYHKVFVFLFLTYFTMCEPGCKFGECVGPNKCRCFPGYTGKTCSQDVNECGFKPRPCQHRCVNTHGSYKCFCPSGHMRLPDATCSNSRTCAMTNCQYGCKDTEEGPRCLCPSPGLRLAPNGRACLDIDECVSDKAFCPYNRRCVNTFGSYFCKCHVGFELKYISGWYDCVALPSSLKAILIRLVKSSLLVSWDPPSCSRPHHLWGPSPGCVTELEPVSLDLEGDATGQRGSPHGELKFGKLSSGHRTGKESSNYRTIALLSHASKVMLKILQARLQHYVN
ncbi:hypothetical protein FD755_024634, partial [Muntiacus reevesi]